MLAGALALVFGLVKVVAPRRVLAVGQRFALVGYENPGDLEPADWFVSLVRAAGALTALAGLIALGVEWAARRER